MSAYDPDEEVRLGIVLYGGVSLAIYINGVVQELFNLVRATAPKVDEHGRPGTDLLVADDENLPDDERLTEVQKCYRRLAQLDAEGNPADEAVTRRFVVDIISGSSAGGINGVYLAKALANEATSINSLKNLWIEQGGLEELLDDGETRKKLRHRMPLTSPHESLFSSDLMYLRLLDALDDQDAAGPVPAGPDWAPPSPYVEELDLWVTTTDLDGLPLPIQLADRKVTEKRHRHVFHFVFGEAQADKGRRNDFVPRHNRMLAFAARATSAFPVAFRPAQLADIDRVKRSKAGKQLSKKIRTTSDLVEENRKQLSDEPDERAPEPIDRTSTDDEWAAWFRPYRDLDPNFDYASVSFSDGGGIDNKPFGWATDTLATRTAALPVDRWLLYVEPDPGDPVHDPTADRPERPDVLSSTVSAASLGRVENIRDDIERLAEASHRRERIGQAIESIEERLKTIGSNAEKAAASGDWFDEGSQAMDEWGLQYAAYFRLRIEAQQQEFARSMARLPWHAPESPKSRAYASLVSAWITSDYIDPYEQTREEAEQSAQNREDQRDTEIASPVLAYAAADRENTKYFLRSYDISYRIRRLVFMARRADDLLRQSDDELEEIVGVTLETAAEFRSEIRIVKAALGVIESRLRRHVPSIRSHLDTTARASDFVLSDAEVEQVLSEGPTELWNLRQEDFRGFAQGVAAFLRALFKAASDEAGAALAVDPKKSLVRNRALWRLRRDYERFADYDQVTFPLHLTSTITGEADEVQVARISPKDATRFFEEGEREKVAGNRLGHFGAFLDKGWRENDIMWGRLDTAERLVSLFGPAGGLPDRAQDDRLSPREGELTPTEDILFDLFDAILEEEWFADGRPGAKSNARSGTREKRLVAFQDEFDLPPWRDSGELLAIGARVGNITSNITAKVSQSPAASFVQRTVAAVTWVLSGLAVFAAPKHLLRTPVRTAGLAATVVGILLLVLGSVWDWASSPGLTIVGIGAAALVASIFRLITKRNVLLTLKALLVVAVVLWVGYGVYRLGHWINEDWPTWDEIGDWLPG